MKASGHETDEGELKEGECDGCKILGLLVQACEAHEKAIVVQRDAFKLRSEKLAKRVQELEDELKRK